MSDLKRSRYRIETEPFCAAEAGKIICGLDRKLERCSNVSLFTKEEEGISAVFRFPGKEDTILTLRLFAKLLYDYFLLFDYLDEISFSVFAATFFRDYNAYLLLARTITRTEKDPVKLEERFYELCKEFALKPYDPAVLLKLLVTGKARSELWKKGTEPAHGIIPELCKKKEEMPEWFPSGEQDPRPLLQMLRDRSLTESCPGSDEEKQRRHLLICRTLLEERIVLLRPRDTSADRSREYGIAAEEYEKTLKRLAKLRIL